MNPLVFRPIGPRDVSSYTVWHRRSWTDLGTVTPLDDGTWHAKSSDGKANFAFRLRQDAGLFLLRNASHGNCEPGCPCAEG